MRPGIPLLQTDRDHREALAVNNVHIPDDDVASRKAGMDSSPTVFSGLNEPFVNRKTSSLFPSRRSRYLDTVKRQLQVNSARAAFSDGGGMVCELETLARIKTSLDGGSKRDRASACRTDFREAGRRSDDGHRCHPMWESGVGFGGRGSAEKNGWCRLEVGDKRLITDAGVRRRPAGTNRFSRPPVRGSSKRSESFGEYVSRLRHEFANGPPWRHLAGLRDWRRHLSDYSLLGSDDRTDYDRQALQLLGYYTDDVPVAVTTTPPRGGGPFDGTRLPERKRKFRRV